MSAPLGTVVTFLEMRQPPQLDIPQPPGQYSLMDTPRPPIHFYRYLYRQVGAAHAWHDRERLSDKELAALIHKDGVEIYVLYVNGVPAGFAELDFSTLPEEAELAYFGLIPDFIGQGLGKYLLAQAIDLAWRKAPRRLIVQTCTLDHPGALPLYQKCGFHPYRREQKSVQPLP